MSNLERKYKQIIQNSIDFEGLSDYATVEENFHLPLANSKPQITILLDFDMHILSIVARACVEIIEQGETEEINVDEFLQCIKNLRRTLYKCKYVYF